MVSDISYTWNGQVLGFELVNDKDTLDLEPIEHFCLTFSLAAIYWDS